MGNVAVKIDRQQRKAASWGNTHEDSILIIDEANRTRAQITQMLKQKGFDKEIEADNGTHAMKILAELLQKGDKLPDLILYNVSYEIEDRVQFCVKLRELGSAEFKRMPIILLASTANERLDLLAQHIGNALVVVRPVSPEKLGKYVQHLIQKSRA